MTGDRVNDGKQTNPWTVKAFERVETKGQLYRECTKNRTSPKTGKGNANGWLRT